MPVMYLCSATLAVTAKTAVEKLSHSDGACVGTTFKKDGKFENNVDPDRVVEFMNIVKEFRKTLV